MPSNRHESQRHYHTDQEGKLHKLKHVSLKEQQVTHISDAG